MQGYDGTDYDLPAVATREFSNKIYATLENIKHGRMEDKHQWIFEV